MPIIPADFALVSVIFPPQGPLPYGAAFTFGVGVAVPAGLTPVSVANIVKTDLTTSGMHNLWAGSVSPSKVLVKFGPNDTGGTGEAAYTEAGGETGATGAASTSILVRKNTLFGGRTGRGRMYIPGQSEGAIDSGGFIQAATLADAQGRVNTFLGDMDAHLGGMFLLHNEGGAGAAMPPRHITSLTVESICANQRRRQRR
jgi:hypothetical protein